MGMKKIIRINENMEDLIEKLPTSQLSEGPFDFVRGAAGEVGRQVKQSGIGQAVGDIVKSGQLASASGELEKAISQFAMLLAKRNKIKGALGQPTTPQPQAQPQPAQQRQPQQAAQQPAPQGQQRGTPDAFRTTEKPKGRTGKHGFEYTFSSFLQATHGERIDEGFWDFVKGAGSAVGSKLRDKINAYGDQDSMLKSVVNAGKQASVQGNQRKMQDNLVQAEADASKALQQVIAMTKRFGGTAQEAVKRAVSKLPQDLQVMVVPVLMQHLK